MREELYVVCVKKVSGEQALPWGSQPGLGVAWQERGT